jgi:hypothetical protein
MVRIIVGGVCRSGSADQRNCRENENAEPPRHDLHPSFLRLLRLVYPYKPNLRGFADRAQVSACRTDTNVTALPARGWAGSFSAFPFSFKDQPRTLS